MILIRHGQSTANADGVWQGQLDFPLSGLGREQARLAGRTLEGEAISGFYASPLSRAFETARLAAREVGFAGEVISLPGLTERHGGALQGTTREQRESGSPELMRKFLSLPEEERWDLVGAETDEDILARFAEALSTVRSHHGPGDTLVVVSHGGVMRSFLRGLFGEDILSGEVRAPNASITRIEWNTDGSSPRLLDLALTDHLPREPDATTSE